jgi:HSP20 family protein
MIGSMRSRFSPRLPADVTDFVDEVRQAFLELGQSFGADVLAGECLPAVDVYESDQSMDIVVDLPGVDRSAIRVLAKGHAVLIVGEKATERPHAESTFHLVERDFGRFARTVRLAHACDTGQARARFANGELHISLPKIKERRGRPVSIEIS